MVFQSITPRQPDKNSTWDGPHKMKWENGNMWFSWMKPRACPQNEAEHKIQPREALRGLHPDSWDHRNGNQWILGTSILRHTNMILFAKYSRPQLQAPVFQRKVCNASSNMYYIYVWQICIYLHIPGTQMSQKKRLSMNLAWPDDSANGSTKKVWCGWISTLPSECHVKSLNVFVLSCHVMPSISSQSYGWHFQIFGIQFTRYTTYIQDSTFCGFSNSMWYYARPSPSSISSTSGLNGKAWPQLKAFFLGGGLPVSF